MTILDLIVHRYFYEHAPVCTKPEGSWTITLKVSIVLRRNETGIPIVTKVFGAYDRVPRRVLPS